MSELATRNDFYRVLRPYTKQLDIVENTLTQDLPDTPFYITKLTLLDMLETAFGAGVISTKMDVIATLKGSK